MVDTILQRTFHVTPVPAWLTREILTTACLLYEQKTYKNTSAIEFRNYVSRIRSKNGHVYCSIQPTHEYNSLYRKTHFTGDFSIYFYMIPIHEQVKNTSQIESQLKKIPIKLLEKKSFCDSMVELYKLLEEMNSTVKELRSVLELYSDSLSY